MNEKNKTKNFLTEGTAEEGMTKKEIKMKQIKRPKDSRSIMIDEMIEVWGDQIKVEDNTIIFKSYVYQNEDDLEKHFLKNTKNDTPEGEIFILEKIWLELQIAIFVLKGGNTIYCEITESNKEKNLKQVTTYEEMAIDIQDRIKQLKAKVSK